MKCCKSDKVLARENCFNIRMNLKEFPVTVICHLGKALSLSEFEPLEAILHYESTEKPQL